VKRVLVVDDDVNMARTLCDILSMHGWETEARHSGEAAVEAVAASDFAAVLMDVKMQGITGVEALARIRRLRPRARVILMTAYSSAELLQRAVSEGALQILSKPVSLPSLVDLLETSLNGGEPILVVDDDPEFLRSLSDPLRASGFSVLEATSLDHGLNLLQERRPVAAVLDLRLGNGAGPLDAVLAIKHASPAVAVILCSGYPDLIDQTRAAAPPGAVYGAVQKPFAPDHLIGMLDELVHGA
jgi:two-component system, NtrC family, response regulator HydG